MESDQESTSSSSSSSSSASSSSSSSSSSSISIYNRNPIHNKNSIHDKTSYEEIKVSIVLFLLIFILYTFIYFISILQKEVFIWVDSELKDLYKIDDKVTWAEQKEKIITKLLPPLYKLVNRKYDVTNKELLNMLYMRWRSRHRINNIELQGEEQVKNNKRRVKKNTRMQDVSKYSINMK